MQRPTLFQALSILHCFRRKLIELTPEAYDEAFDVITDFLSQVNDETYRLVTLQGEKKDAS